MKEGRKAREERMPRKEGRREEGRTSMKEGEGRKTKEGRKVENGSKEINEGRKEGRRKKEGHH